LKKVLACAALAALLTAGCNSDGDSPTDPSQVNIEFTTTDIAVGTGAQAMAGSAATVHYTVWLYNPNGPESKGRQIDSSVGGAPFGPFIVGAGQYIRGFEQAILGMRVDGRRRAYLPASLAYGGSGSQDGTIPPNAALVFEIELVALQ
jgi:FKBP-type peptidyl-prolyl cis-trans isomerase FkpA